MNFSNKTVLITGGGSGIGLAAALLFKQCKATVYVLDIKIASQTNGIHFIDCDVSDFKATKKAIDDIILKEKKINCVFANAGVLLSSKLIDCHLDEIQKTIAININGIIHTLKCVLPFMIAQKAGSIVLMGSDQSLIGKYGNSVYGCTKAAVAQLAKSIAIEYAENNIRINCVCPGTIDTPFCRNAVANYAKKHNLDKKFILDELSAAQPIKRLGTANEVANLVLFLCSDLSSYMTGTVIPVDGGYTAQ